MDKATLRRALKKKRSSLSPELVYKYSQAITQRLISLVAWDMIKTIHCYVPLEGSNEVDTRDLLSWLKEKGVELTIPLGRIPTKQELTSKYDLLIVPILGFDLSHNRLGYGGGFYDRLLASQPQAQKIGLGYELSFVPAGIPTAPHDQPLDSVITEMTTY